jgi:hypothetical protein
MDVLPHALITNPFTFNFQRYLVSVFSDLSWVLKGLQIIQIPLTGFKNGIFQGTEME